jgi:ATP-dependent phosphofructokinase / diphosphate-dependent phosphofructokinase
MKIGVLTSGGDCPGLNAVIRGITRKGEQEGYEVVGILNGWKGLFDESYIKLDIKSVAGIVNRGGTILGTSRFGPFQQENGAEILQHKVARAEFDALIAIGGEGSMHIAQQCHELGINIVGVPKTIDNDLSGTDYTFGFDTAVQIATEAIDRLHSTANSHNRVMVIELMGHNAGWLALYSGVAGGGDVILIPEIPYNEESIKDYLLSRAYENKRYSIVVVAEGIKTPSKDKSPGQYMAKRIGEMTGLEARETVLGYIQRGGSPTPMDRILATRFGAAAANMIADKDYGKMVAQRNCEISSIPLAEVAGKTRLVEPNNPLVLKAKEMGTSFGI